MAVLGVRLESLVLLVVVLLLGNTAEGSPQGDPLACFRNETVCEKFCEKYHKGCVRCPLRESEDVPYGCIPTKPEPRAVAPAGLEVAPQAAVSAPVPFRICETFNLVDKFVVLNFRMDTTQPLHNGKAVYVAPNINPSPAVGQHRPNLYMYFSHNLLPQGGGKGWCVANVDAPFDTPHVAYVAFTEMDTPWDPRISSSWLTGNDYAFGPVGALVAPGIQCNSPSAVAPAGLEVAPQAAVSAPVPFRICETFNLVDKFVVLNFRMDTTQPLHNGKAVYVAPNINPSPAVGQHRPNLYMYFSHNLLPQGGGKGWCVANVDAPIDTPHVAYVAFTEMDTPWDPRISSSWLTGNDYAFGPVGALVAPGIQCNSPSAVAPARLEVAPQASVFGGLETTPHPLACFRNETVCEKFCEKYHKGCVRCPLRESEDVPYGCVPTKPEPTPSKAA
eukprot:RCo029815